MSKKRRKIRRYGYGTVVIIDEPTVDKYIDDMFHPERYGKIVRKRKK